VRRCVDSLDDSPEDQLSLSLDVRKPKGQPEDYRAEWRGVERDGMKWCQGSQKKRSGSGGEERATDTPTPANLLYSLGILYSDLLGRGTYCGGIEVGTP
jgi:hypothetical protein